MDKPSFMAIVSKLVGEEYKLLGERIDREQPSAVCSSFPAYAIILSRLAKEGRLRVPHYNIVTDSISINSIWWRPGCDGWFLPNEDSAAVLLEAGIDPTRLHVSGVSGHRVFRPQRGRPSAARPGR